MPPSERPTTLSRAGWPLRYHQEGMHLTRPFDLHQGLPAFDCGFSSPQIAKNRMHIARPVRTRVAAKVSRCVLS